MHRLRWRKQESVFTAGCPAVRMKQWISCLRETLCLIRTSIVTTMTMGIMERDITVGKINRGVPEMGAAVNT